MAILNIQLNEPGQSGVYPRIIRIETNDSVATVTASGYLTDAVKKGLIVLDERDMVLMVTKESASAANECGWYEISYSSGAWSLVPPASPGDVVLPTVANRIAHFTNTTGTLSGDAADITNLGDLALGASGTEGILTLYPSTALKGSLVIAPVNNTGNTATTISNAAMGQASVISIPDPGQATSEFIIADSAGIQHITSGSLNVDAGALISGLAAGGSAGSYIGYSNTAAMGSLRLLTVDNAGDFAVTISNASHAQASVVSIPDGGQATSEFIIADSAGTQNITSGGLQVDAGAISSGLLAGGFAGNLVLWANTTLSGNLQLLAVDNGSGDFDTIISNAAAIGQDQTISIPDSGQATSEFIIADSGGIQHITSGALAVDAGIIDSGLAAGGFAGQFRAYSTTAAMGSLNLLAVDNAGDFAVTISNASHGQASVVSIPDGGQATTEFIIADSAGTQNITSGALQVDAGAVSVGLAAGGFAGNLVLWANTTASGNLAMLAVDNGSGNFDTVISNAAAVGQDQTITIPDAGAATANFLLDAGSANIIAHQEFVGLTSVIAYSAGTWTTTRVAQGNYVARHTAADDTTIIGIDLTPMIRTASSKGFRLDSFDVIYSITTLALDAHSVVVDRIEYADNVAVSVNSIGLTGSLATATQASPYVTNIAVTTPAFDNTADSKYVLELTVDAGATSDYDFYGIMLRFSQTIG